MANSRLEKIGTIYTRTRGLIQSGALNYNDRPLWFDVYEAFPPKEEPRFDRPIPNMKIRKIFYEEDTIRAKLHRNLGRVGIVNLVNQHTSSFTQKFVSTYKLLECQHRVGQCNSEILYQEALDALKKERETQLQGDSNEESTDEALTTAFKRATQQQKATSGSISTVNIQDLFKE